MAAFLAAGNILLEAVVGAAGLGRSWTSYLATLFGLDMDVLHIHVPALAEGFNLQDPSHACPVVGRDSSCTSSLLWLLTCCSPRSAALCCTAHASAFGMGSSSCYYVVLLLAAAASARSARALKAADPTYGFTSVRLDESNFVLQRPFNEASGARYSFDGTVRKLWVLSSDKPHARQSHTSPRTEIRMAGYDYSSGVWQFEGYGYVPSGTTGVSIMQVFGAGQTATTLMLHVYDGALRYYDRQIVEDAIYDRWFRLNVVHDVEASTLAVYIDGEQKLHVHGRGGDSHYFKFGVYAQNHDSSCMESRWKDVRIFQK
ncbi:Citrate-binding protein [Hordeum vulgare]|nr:Citrate-binding protein [Hordeum vulgare]